MHLLLNFCKYDVKRYYSSDYLDIFRLRIGDFRAILRVIDKDRYVLSSLLLVRGLNTYYLFSLYHCFLSLALFQIYHEQIIHANVSILQL